LSHLKTVVNHRTFTAQLIVISTLLLSGCINLPIREINDKGLQDDLVGMSYIDLPYVEQETPISCGLAVTQSVTQYWDTPIDQSLTFKEMPPEDTAEGYSLAELKDIITRRSKLKAFIIKGDEALLNKMVAKGRPIIVAIRSEARSFIEPPFEFMRRLVRIIAPEFKHYIVVIGIDKSRVAVMDPAQGYYVIEQKRFAQIWAEMGNASLLIAK